MVRPRETLSWDEFRATAPPFSIALDGFVSDYIKFDPQGPFANFNHHEGCDRLGTRSTCGQVMMAIKQGLFQTFQKNGEPHAILHVNDPDNDVCMSVWLMQNYERIAGMKSEPLITRLVAVVDFLDSTAGLFPLDVNSRIRREIGWMFQPYSDARQSGRLSNMSVEEMTTLIEAVCARISDYTIGKGQKINKLNVDYKIIYKGNGWAMIEELGFEARAQLANDGIYAFISVKQLPNERLNCSIGKMSPFVPFPIPLLYEDFNQAEGNPTKKHDRWGGGDTIGGSPRNGGTKLTMEELQKITEARMNNLPR